MAMPRIPVAACLDPARAAGPTSRPPSATSPPRNARIGVAKAANIRRSPDRHLTASRAANVGELFHRAEPAVVDRPAAVQPLLTPAWRQRANRPGDRRLDERTSRSYRQAVLTAFQEVEDNLASCASSRQEAAVQESGWWRRRGASWS
jgi:outer membrane protein TolC